MAAHKRSRSADSLPAAKLVASSENTPKPTITLRMVAPYQIPAELAVLRPTPVQRRRIDTATQALLNGMCLSMIRRMSVTPEFAENFAGMVSRIAALPLTNELRVGVVGAREGYMRRAEDTMTECLHGDMTPERLGEITWNTVFALK